MSSQKPKVAYFSPMPPQKTGIADYSQELLPYLSAYWDCDWVYDTQSRFLPPTYPHTLPYAAFGEWFDTAAYDALLFNIGNNAHHAYIYHAMLEYPGISVLHDYDISGLLSVSENLYPHFNISLAKANQTTSALQHDTLNPFMNQQVFTRSLGVILLSQASYQQAMSDYGTENPFITYIPSVLYSIPPEERVAPADRPALKQRWDFPPDAFLIGSFGFLTAAKRPFEIIQAFQRYEVEFPQAYLLFVGENQAFEALDALKADIAARGLTHKVRFLGYTPLDTLHRLMQITDISLNLRYPSNHSGASGALLRLLSLGIPTIVTNTDSFANFLDTVVHKIAVPSESKDEVADIYDALTLLTKLPEYRSQLSDFAQKYVLREHAPERCARLYADFMATVLNDSLCQQKIDVDRAARQYARLP